MNLIIQVTLTIAELRCRTSVMLLIPLLKMMIVSTMTTHWTRHSHAFDW